jgi:hypothetical protein
VGVFVVFLVVCCFGVLMWGSFGVGFGGVCCLCFIWLGWVMVVDVFGLEVGVLCCGRCV